MGDQTFMYIVQNGHKRLSITKRLYKEIIADTNNKDWHTARTIVINKLNDCPKEVRADNSDKKVDIDL